MHGYYWGFRGMPRSGRFACLNYVDSPLGFWLMIALMVVGILLVVLLLVNNRRKSNQINGDSQALVILKRRYAKGEVATDEFQKMKKDLK